MLVPTERFLINTFLLKNPVMLRVKLMFLIGGHGVTLKLVTLKARWASWPGLLGVAEALEILGKCQLRLKWLQRGLGR